MGEATFDEPLDSTQTEVLFEQPTAQPPPPAQLALYRRYRPDTFADVIGQEHVTEPLQRALTNNRVSHAYLFSGPRGCGKTTSARILARALNCERGPLAEPCGACGSCRDLARGGPGSIDVIEIDAASHGGVDDARDLRERAFFSPVASRYKIYIVDEAHMVTPAGFNALLKLVEEPPPHVKFIFATTEPDKVIEVGQDPRRFAEDLLRRLRDLVIVAAVPDALTSGLVDVSADQAERLSSQAAALGPGELTRAAEVIAVGLTDMRGTTAPRLHLELMCARVLLPGADVADRGVHARLDRLERRIGMAGLPADAHAAAAAPARQRAVEPPLPAAPASPPQPSSTEPAPAEPVKPSQASSTSPDSMGDLPKQPGPGAVSAPASTNAPAEPAGGLLSVTEVRRLWPEVPEEVKGKRRFTWILLSQNAQVTEVRSGSLVLSMANVGARDSFAKGGSEDVLREALVVVLGADLKIEVVVDAGQGGIQSAPTRTAPQRATSSWADAPTTTPPEASLATVASNAPTAAAGDSAPHSAEDRREATSSSAVPAPASPPQSADPAARDRARQGIRPTRRGGARDDDVDDRDALADRRDSDVEDSDESHTELLARHLGAEIIAEEEHGA